MIYLALYWEFFKIGLFSLGGGLATLPFLYKLAETRPQWISTQAIADMIAISESTPGPIGINMATFSGFQVGGALGGLVATLGEITPSVIIIILIARFLTAFDKNKYVKDAFYGLRPAVVALITFALIKLMGVTLFASGIVHPIETVLYAVLVIGVLVWKKVHPLIWIVLGAIAGVLFQLPS